MANPEHLAILKQGVDVWNEWSKEHPREAVDLSEANLRGADLNQAHLGCVNLTNTDLRGANLYGADLYCAYLRKADLSEACLWEADLNGADFRGANLRGANLNETKLMEANLEGVDLTSATLYCANLGRANLKKATLNNTELTGATLVWTEIDGAKITGSSIYAINVWNLIGEFEEQKDLRITPEGEPIITVDNIKIAQFVYLILNNQEIRDVLNTLTSKSVLILGRFSIPERKAILEKLKEKLRACNLLPIVFDFERPTNRDFTETIKTLAGMACFVIADVTNPKSSPLELQATVPDYQIPFVPIIQSGEHPFSMMANLQTKYNWVLPTIIYETGDDLIDLLQDAVIDPAFKMHKKLQLIKATEQQSLSLKEFVKK